MLESGILEEFLFNQVLYFSELLIQTIHFAVQESGVFVLGLLLDTLHSLLQHLHFRLFELSDVFNVVVVCPLSVDDLLHFYHSVLDER